MDREELLKEAKRRFPKGCRVMPVGDNDGDYIYTLRYNETTFVSPPDDNMIIFGDCGFVMLYSHGTWAKVISYPHTITKEQKSKILQLIKEI